MAASNAKGESFQRLFVIGKSVRPGCFTGVITYPADIVLKKRAGWIVACLRPNGFENRTGNLSVKEERVL